MIAARPSAPTIAAIVVTAAWTTDARALWDDRVEVSLTEALTYDDNVFRLSEEQDPVTAIGSPSKGDTYMTTELGLEFDIPASAQQFTGYVVWSRHRFSHFDTLNLNGHEGQVEWRWQLGKSLSGEIGYGEALALTSPANIQNGVQSTVANFLDSKMKYVSAEYKLTAAWQIRAGINRSSQSNSAPEFQLSDAKFDSVDLEFAHLTKASSRVGIRGRSTDGDLQNPQLINGVAVDNSFRQRGISAFVEWPVTSRSSIGASIGPVRRNHMQLPERDHDMVAYWAAYEWRPSARLTTSLSAQKDISAEEQVNVGFVLLERVGLQSYFRQSEKMDWTAYVSYSNRTYLGHPSLALDPAASPREEQLYQGGVSLSYRPSAVLRLDLSARRQTRASAETFGDYDASVYRIAVRVSF